MLDASDPVSRSVAMSNVWLTELNSEERAGLLLSTRTTMSAVKSIFEFGVDVLFIARRLTADTADSPPVLI